jgi:hypothetical protein
LCVELEGVILSPSAPVFDARRRMACCPASRLFIAKKYSHALRIRRWRQAVSRASGLDYESDYWQQSKSAAKLRAVTVEDFLKTIAERLRVKARGVCADMYEGYRLFDSQATRGVL